MGHITASDISERTHTLRRLRMQLTFAKIELLEHKWHNALHEEHNLCFSDHSGGPLCDLDAA